MGRYYDQQVPECEDCHYFAKDAYPDGTPYVACRLYGYILHEMILASCDQFRTEAQWRREEMMKAAQRKAQEKSMRGNE